MELNAYFKSIIEHDPAPIVICNMEHEMLYLNPAAIKRYAARGGAAMVGRSVFGCHNPSSNQKIEMVIDWFKKSSDNNVMFISYNPIENKDLYMIALRDEEKNLIGYYEKHASRNRETSPVYDFK